MLNSTIAFLVTVTKTGIIWRQTHSVTNFTPLKASVWIKVADLEIKVRGEKKPDIKENQKKEERDGREEIQPNRQLNMEGNEENGMCSNGNCACRIF